MTEEKQTMPEFVCLLNGEYFRSFAADMSQFRALAKKHFGISRKGRLPENAEVRPVKAKKEGVDNVRLDSQPLPV